MWCQNLALGDTMAFSPRISICTCFVCIPLGLYTSTAGGFATDSSFSNVFGNQNSTLDATGKSPPHEM